jgi:hypothetical protein
MTDDGKPTKARSRDMLGVMSRKIQVSSHGGDANSEPRDLGNISYLHQQSAPSSRPIIPLTMIAHARLAKDMIFPLLIMSVFQAFKAQRGAADGGARRSFYCTKRAPCFGRRGPTSEDAAADRSPSNRFASSPGSILCRPASAGRRPR